MQITIVRVTVDRRTGQQLEKQTIGFEEIDEDAYYRPLVEIFGKRVLEALQNKQKGGLAESEDRGALEVTG